MYLPRWNCYQSAAFMLFYLSVYMCSRRSRRSLNQAMHTTTSTYDEGRRKEGRLKSLEIFYLNSIIGYANPRSAACGSGILKEWVFVPCINIGLHSLSLSLSPYFPFAEFEPRESKAAQQLWTAASRPNSIHACNNCLPIYYVEMAIRRTDRKGKKKTPPTSVLSYKVHLSIPVLCRRKPKSLHCTLPLFTAFQHRKPPNMHQRLLWSMLKSHDSLPSPPSHSQTSHRLKPDRLARSPILLCLLFIPSSER